MNLGGLHVGRFAGAMDKTPARAYSSEYSNTDRLANSRADAAADLVLRLAGR
jgi:hypothetical protein